MKPQIYLLSILLFVFSTSTAIAAPDIAGKWKVYTTLVSAYDAVNPDYNPGDKRLEKWKVKASRKNATLTTPSGVIQGVKVGKAWVFDQFFDTGLGIITNIHLVARVQNGRLRGTIESRYYSTQFGYLLGNDAWSFKGTRP